MAPIIVKQQNSGGQHVPLSPNKQLQIFLWYLCNQESMREVSQLYGVTKSTVYTTVKSVCDAVLTTRERVYDFLSFCCITCTVASNLKVLFFDP